MYAKLVQFLNVLEYVVTASHPLKIFPGISLIELQFKNQNEKSVTLSLFSNNPSPILSSELHPSNK